MDLLRRNISRGVKCSDNRGRRSETNLCESQTKTTAFVVTEGMSSTAETQSEEENVSIGQVSDDSVDTSETGRENVEVSDIYKGV